MELLVCIFSTLGMTALVSYLLFRLFLKIDDKWFISNFIGILLYLLFFVEIGFFWVISSRVTLARQELPAKVEACRDSLRKSEALIDSLKKDNDAMALKLYGRRNKDLINSLSDEDYREIFGEEKPLEKDDSNVSDEAVYICTGETSTKYHSDPDCLGLSHCSGEIEEVSVEDAEAMGRTPCKICY